MALLILTNDVGFQRLVPAYGVPDDFSLPAFKQEDILDISYSAVVPTGNILQPHSRLSLVGYSLTISIGPVGAPIAQQTSFTAADDNYTLRGSLSLNTAGVAALADGTTTIFECQLSLGSTAVHRTHQNVSINKSVNIASALVPIAGDTALGRVEGDRLYMRKQGRAGEGFVLTSLDGLKSCICYLDNDGQFKADPIS